MQAKKQKRERGRAMSKGKVEVEIPAELYEEAKQAVEALSVYESLEELVRDAIRWNIRNLKNRQRGLYSVRVSESVMQLLAEAVKKTGKSMEDLTAEDVKRILVWELLGLWPEEFKLLEAIVEYKKKYNNIQEYVREIILSALANDLAETGKEIAQKN